MGGFIIEEEGLGDHNWGRRIGGILVVEKGFKDLQLGKKD
jgi:hypothetical protein